MEQPPQEKNKLGYHGFVPKEGPVPSEYAQVAQKRLRDLMTRRDNLTEKLLEIDPKDEQQFNELHEQIVIINDSIKKIADMISETMDWVEQETRAFMEHAINRKKDKMH